jgi:hypothetical protein
MLLNISPEFANKIQMTSSQSNTSEDDGDYSEVLKNLS